MSESYEMQRTEGPGQALAPVETAAAGAVAAQARAVVEARYYLAMRRPRDIDEVRVRILKECSRPGFAEKARYHKPVGDGVEGPSIRFVEAALRCMTNVQPDAATIHDDAARRIVRASVSDLESNVTFTRDVVIDKTVERSDPGGRRILGQRTNAKGRPVFIVEATEDELANKEASAVSKALRQLGLRIIPSDIVDECMDRVLAVQERRDAADPDAARKKLADAFAEIGVPPSALRDFLGHDLGQCSPPVVAKLRALWAAIRDGETTWQAATEGTASATAPTTPARPAGSRRTAPPATAPTAPMPPTAPPRPAPPAQAELPVNEKGADPSMPLPSAMPPVDGPAPPNPHLGWDEPRPDPDPPGLADEIVARLHAHPDRAEDELPNIEMLNRKSATGAKMSDYDYVRSEYLAAKAKAGKRPR